MSRGRRLLGIAIAVLVLGTGAALAANEAPAPGSKAAGKAAARSRKSKRRPAAAPAAPTGVAPSSASPGADYGVDPKATIVEARNESGETVYSVSASHSDVSSKLRDMASSATGAAAEGEEEERSNPRLPAWRWPLSDRPDPVVQSDFLSAEIAARLPIQMSAPATGFSFAGTPYNAGSPSDSNGAVGNDQFVEVVNTRYQVWSLNRATKVATSVLGPAYINTLWSGFGGACQTQNSGDPIALFDKLANRWLISQFTSASSNGSYYQCVALSTTADATGSYYRWAFAVPSGHFGDYPHFGAWSDAYYMMAHAFASTAGGYIGAIFAALDRTRMLSGDPGATWQVIEDPTEGGHMPADLDGFAPPPTGAPGIFLSLHSAGMFVYRMKVDFASPANTVKTKQAVLPVAPSTGACGGGGTCIPQPGTTRVLDSLGDRLMFRAAYRNFVDHESLVISHSVDPSVPGVVSGVRWYDFRLSGAPDPACSSYPCIYQQGTVADAANGRSRWMPSIAMDTAENILVGYSTTGFTKVTDNHSIRYTGRAKSDPPGTMTAPEVILATGTVNNFNNTRWGDYTSMVVDPYDDCTFWYVNQYYTTTTWSTWVASVSFPSGSGVGQCPATTCVARPASAPAIGTATVVGDNLISVTWTGISPTPGAYAIERAPGACGSEGLYQPVAAVPGSASAFTDGTVMGGLTYSYRVIAAADAAGKCQATVASGCVSATATGRCTLKPAFSGATAAASNDSATCGVRVQWTPAAPSCPLTPNVRYNVFRGTVPDFVPSASNRIATCAPGPDSYLDTAGLTSGTSYYYVVRAEDDSTGNGGECGGGNEESNAAVVSGAAYGPGMQSTAATWTDGGGDGSAYLSLDVAGPGDTTAPAWRFVTTAADAGANHTPGGAYAYRDAGPSATDTYLANACSEMQTPALVVDAAATNLQYWERHQLEYNWDGVAVEYSTNGGPWTDVPPPSNSTADGCAATDATTDWGTLSCTGATPANGCGYSSSKSLYTGPFGSGTGCTDWVTGAIVTPYAHRCHRIAGLNPGDTVRFRWRFTSDPAAQYAGFYLDDVAVTNVLLPDACSPDVCGGLVDGSPCSDGNACTVGESCETGVCAGGAPVVCGASDACHVVGVCDPASGACSNPAAPDGTACDDGDACTTSDACGGGACAGVPVAAPAEVDASVVVVLVGTDAGITWDPAAGATSSDVLRGLLGGLPVGSAPADELCLGNFAGTSATDASVPLPGAGFWYVVRGVNACAGPGPYGFAEQNGVPTTPRASTTCP